MTIQEFLSSATITLDKAGIESGRLDVLILLEDALKKDRSYLLAHPEINVEGSTLYSLQKKVERRARHEPLAFIRRKSEFYGREFYVNQHVLVPRPESEAMIELALEVLKVTGYKLQVTDKSLQILDVGTGSGALGIIMKLEVPKVEVTATDISQECLQVACKNAKKHEVKIKLLQGDLLQPIYNLQPITYNLVLANLPYVPDNHPINQAATQEPHQAIFGGLDGLDLYRNLFGQIKNLSAPSQYVLTESLISQHSELKKIAAKNGYNLNSANDFIQCFQFVK